MATKTLNKKTPTKTTTKVSKPTVMKENNIDNTVDNDVVYEDLQEEELIEPDRNVPINCHSIYPGTRIYNGEKLTYTFEGIGSKRRVQYGDLVDGLLTSKPSIVEPWIIIDDLNVLNLPLWEEIRTLYESMYDPKELMKILDLPTVAFKQELEKLPVTGQTIIKNIVASGIENGSFDSVNKVNVIDEVCHTNLKVLFD